MDKKAIDAARIEFQHAQDSLDDMKAANTFSDVRRHWAAFLVAAGRVFTKLEQGAKSSARSKDWYASIKHLRKTDPLLSYIWNARNADEHGIEAVVELHPGSAKFVDPSPEEQEAFQRQMAKQDKPYMALGLLEVVAPHARLVPVVQRGGQNHYLPPRPEPLNVGMLMLAFMSELIEAAESYAL